MAGTSSSSLQDYNVWVRFKLPLLGEIRFNPIVSFGSILLIVGFVVWCSILQENAPFFELTKSIVKNFTWFYIGSMNCWAIFIIYLYFRYATEESET